MIFCGALLFAHSLGCESQGAHWVTWTPQAVQIGVALGPKSDDHLILLVPAEGCKAGVKIYDGRFGDLDKATEFLAASKVCEKVEARAVEASILREEAMRFLREHPWQLAIGEKVTLKGSKGNEITFEASLAGAYRDAAECEKFRLKQSKIGGPFLNRPIPIEAMVCRDTSK